MAETRTVRAGGAEEAGLGDGWVLAHTSWGARLRLARRFDPAPFEAALDGTLALVRELGPESADEVLALERENRADYPGGPATAPADRDAASIAELWDRGRVFGGLIDDELVAVTALHVMVSRVETDFTSVAAAFRGQGLATAVKAASILAFAADGHPVFGTGGADENAASIRMNERLGYVVEERWRTYRRR